MSSRNERYAQQIKRLTAERDEFAHVAVEAVACLIVTQHDDYDLLDGHPDQQVHAARRARQLASTMKARAR